MNLDQLRERLAAYIAAEQKILGGHQSVQIGDGATARSYTRADLREVRAEIASLSAQITSAEAAQAGTRRVLYPRPFN